MKKLLTTIAVFAFALVFSTQSAEARGHKKHHKNNHGSHHNSHSYVSGHSSCGCKVYTKRYVRYYDDHGHAIYGYSRQPVKHYCQQNRNHRRSSYSYDSCDTNRGHSSNRRSSGWSVSYRF